MIFFCLISAVSISRQFIPFWNHFTSWLFIKYNRWDKGIRVAFSSWRRTFIILLVDGTVFHHNWDRLAALLQVQSINLRYIEDKELCSTSTLKDLIMVCYFTTAFWQERSQISIDLKVKLIIYHYWNIRNVDTVASCDIYIDEV